MYAKVASAASLPQGVVIMQGAASTAMQESISLPPGLPNALTVLLEHRLQEISDL